MSSVTITALLDDVVAIDRQYSKNTDDDEEGDIDKSPPKFHGNCLKSLYSLPTYVQIDTELDIDRLLKSEEFTTKRTPDYYGIEKAAQQHSTPMPLVREKVALIPKQLFTKPYSPYAVRQSTVIARRQHLLESQLSKIEADRRRHSVEAHRHAVNHQRQFMLSPEDKFKWISSMLAVYRYTLVLIARFRAANARRKLRKCLHAVVILNSERRMNKHWDGLDSLPYSCDEFRSLEMFQKFTSYECNAVMKACQPIAMFSNEVLCVEHERPDAAFFILKGNVDFEQLNEQNVTLKVDTARRPMIVGWGALQKVPRGSPVTARCAGECVVAKLFHSDFEHVRTSFPEEMLEHLELHAMRLREKYLTSTFPLTATELSLCPLFEASAAWPGEPDTIRKFSVLRLLGPGEALCLPEVGVVWIREGFLMGQDPDTEFYLPSHLRKQGLIFPKGTWVGYRYAAFVTERKDPRSVLTLTAGNAGAEVCCLPFDRLEDYFLKNMRHLLWAKLHLNRKLTEVLNMKSNAAIHNSSSTQERFLLYDMSEEFCLKPNTMSATVIYGRLWALHRNILCVHGKPSAQLSKDMMLFEHFRCASTVVLRITERSEKGLRTMGGGTHVPHRPSVSSSAKGPRGSQGVHT